jgi:hypothetical protein
MGPDDCSDADRLFRGLWPQPQERDEPDAQPGAPLTVGRAGGLGQLVQSDVTPAFLADGMGQIMEQVLVHRWSPPMVCSVESTGGSLTRVVRELR